MGCGHLNKGKLSREKYLLTQLGLLFLSGEIEAEVRGCYKFWWCGKVTRYTGCVIAQHSNPLIPLEKNIR